MANGQRNFIRGRKQCVEAVGRPISGAPLSLSCTALSPRGLGRKHLAKAGNFGKHLSEDFGSGREAPDGSSGVDHYFPDRDLDCSTFCLSEISLIVHKFEMFLWRNTILRMPDREH